MTDSTTITSVAELLAHARVMETEAYECYVDLAEQMEAHNNVEVAGLFKRLAKEEKKHIERVEGRSGDEELPRMAPWDFKTFETESHGLTGAREVHYLMTPYHALKLAIRAEKRSLAFFGQVIDTTGDDEVRALAVQLRDEEQSHVTLLEEWLAREPKPEDGWDEDPDPPVQPV